MGQGQFKIIKEESKKYRVMHIESGRSLIVYNYKLHSSETIQLPNIRLHMNLLFLTKYELFERAKCVILLVNKLLEENDNLVDWTQNHNLSFGEMVYWCHGIGIWENCSTVVKKYLDIKDRY